jgi:hypothetical protein
MVGPTDADGPPTPSSIAAARIASSFASSAGFVEVITYPARPYQASTPSASHQAPIARTLSADASHAARARSSPKRSRSDGSDVQSVSQNPPFRPLGPCPQTSASTSAMRASGSRSSTCQAVHMPV